MALGIVENRKWGPTSSHLRPADVLSDYGLHHGYALYSHCCNHVPLSFILELGFHHSGECRALECV